MNLQSLKIIKRILCKRCFKLCFQDLIFPVKGRTGIKKSILSDFSVFCSYYLPATIQIPSREINFASKLQM